MGLVGMVWYGLIGIVGVLAVEGVVAVLVLMGVVVVMLFQHAKVSLVLFLLRPMTLLSSACDKGLGREKICILCEKKCFSLATTLKLKFCGISTFKAMELSTL